MSLSPEQLRFVRTFGYLHIPGLLRHRLAEIVQAFEAHITESCGDSYAGEDGFTVSPGINRSEALCRTILDEDRVEGVATSLLGDDYQYWNSALNCCAGDTPWHYETPLRGWKSFAAWYKLLVYLDPLTEQTGALRVIPGSNHWEDGYGIDLRRGIVNRTETSPADPREAWGLRGSEVPSVALASQPGDVIVLSYLTAHASFGGGARRRLLAVVLSRKLSVADADEVRDSSSYGGFTRESVFGDSRRPFPLLATAPPRRLCHLEQLLAQTRANEPSLTSLFGLSSTESVRPSVPGEIGG